MEWHNGKVVLLPPPASDGGGIVGFELGYLGLSLVPRVLGTGEGTEARDREQGEVLGGEEHLEVWMRKK